MLQKPRLGYFACFNRQALGCGSGLMHGGLQDHLIWRHDRSQAWIILLVEGQYAIQVAREQRFIALLDKLLDVFFFHPSLYSSWYTVRSWTCSTQFLPQERL